MTVLPKNWRRDQPPGLRMFVHRSRKLPLRALALASGISPQRLRRLRDGRGAIRPDERATLARLFHVDEAVFDQALRDCLVWKLQRDCQSEWVGVPSDWHKLRAIARDDSLSAPTVGWVLFELSQRDALRYWKRSNRLGAALIAVLETIADGTYPAVYGTNDVVDYRHRDEAKALLEAIELRRKVGAEGRTFLRSGELADGREFFMHHHLSNSKPTKAERTAERARRSGRVCAPGWNWALHQFGWMEEAKKREEEAKLRQEVSAHSN